MLWVCGFRFGLLSLATTLTVFTPGVSVIVAVQFAVPEPLAVPPLAPTPLTVTEEMPLFPNPLSLAVPLTVRLALVSVALLAGDAIVTDGPWVSGVGTVTALLNRW